MPRKTIELSGPHYGVEGFWSYSSTFPFYLEARSVAVDVEIDGRQGSFKISSRAPAKGCYERILEADVRNITEADLIARRLIHEKCKVVASESRLEMIDEIEPFSKEGWARALETA
jgi:hypothetical protein